MASFCRVAVVVPAHNEEYYLPSFLASLAAALARVRPGTAEIVVVDNASTDRTAAVAGAFAAQTPWCHLVTESSLGPGHARAAGARFALERAAARRREDQPEFWLLGTDADAVVPAAWLEDWLRYVSQPGQRPAIATGRFAFEGLARALPTAARILGEASAFTDLLEDHFGVINLAGINHAIERAAYAAIGPYKQRTSVTSDGRVVNIGGEDWDVGVRARAGGYQIACNGHNAVSTSARRILPSPRAYITGEVYRGPFRPVLTAKPQAGAEEALQQEYAELLVSAQQKAILHFALKPIIVSPELLNKPAVRALIGGDLQRMLGNWLAERPRADVFNPPDDLASAYLLPVQALAGARFLDRCLRAQACGPSPAPN